MIEDVFLDWKQNPSEVIVKLRCGDAPLRLDHVHTVLTDTACQVRFPDGRQWSCDLHAEVEGSCTKVQYKEKCGVLVLAMPKKIPFHTWPSLTRTKKEKEALENGGAPALPPRMEKGPAETPPPPEQRRAPRRNVKARGDAPPRGVSTEPTSVKPIAKGNLLPDAGAKRVSGASGPIRDSHAKGSTNGKPHAPAGREAKTKQDNRVKPSTNGPDCRSETRFEQRQEGKAQEAMVEENGSQTPESESRVRLPEDSMSRVRPLEDSMSRATVPCSMTPKTTVTRAEVTVPTVPTTTVPRAEAFRPEVVSCAVPSTTNLSCTVSDTTGPICAVPSAEVPSPAGQLQAEESLGSALMEGLGGEVEVGSRLASEAGPRPRGEAEADALPRTPDPATNGTSAEEKRDASKEEPLEEEKVKAPEPMVNLTFVKNDSYEKGTDLMVVNVYLKDMCRDSTTVLFREQDFTLIFQTRDSNFLRLHSDCGSNTFFRWQVKLRNLIHPEQSTFAFTPSRLDITLKKRHSQRWGGLEAPAPQGAVGGAKVAVPSAPSPLDKSQTVGSVLSPTKEDPRAGDDKPASPLDGVGPRSASEHLPVKQEPPATTPKPTCMVQPMSHAPPPGGQRAEEEEERKVCLPGFTGLVNLGNTCFMNSVIQSLSNTRELRDFFHDRSFETEINCSNPLGTGGRLAVGFAALLRALWKGTHHAFQPSKLKAIVASKASQFTGYVQHDAQEFMAFLLDGLHEDLNRIQNKPYTETVDSDGRTDEVVAEEAWQRHKMRNDSFVVDLFQGQYKSKLVCPVCSKVSITFDPFLYLPVPLPQKQKVLTVFYFAKEPHKKPVKFLVSVSKENSSTAEVLDPISQSVRVKPENLRLTEVLKSRFHRLFLPSHSLDTVSSSDTLLCFELLSEELAKERVMVLRVQQRPQVPSISTSKCAACQKPPLSEEDKLKRCTRCYRVAYCNQTCQKTHWPIHKALCRPNMENVGLPFLVSVPESRLTYARLSQLLEGYSRYSVNVFQPPFQPAGAFPDMGQSRADLPPMPADEDAPGGGEGDSGVLGVNAPPESGVGSARGAGELDTLSTRTVDSGFSEPASPRASLGEKETCVEKAVKPEAVVTGYQQPVEPASSHAPQFYITLLDSNGKEHSLEDNDDSLLDLPDDATLELVWKNNERLKEYVLVRTKELEFHEDPGSASETARAGHFTLEQCLNLFTKPEVLAPEEAWYCPKCQQHREASKQLLLWRLPNVLIIQLKRFSFRSFIWRDKINDMVDFPVRNLDLSNFCIGQKEDVQQRPVYDLYAVINHYGGMIGGHYTAYARLPCDKNSQRSDVGWRLFDDSTVTVVEESQVVTRYAYVLFYRRRNSPVERPPRPPGAEAHAAAASQASSQAIFGTDLDPEGPPQLTTEVTSDLFAHSGDCATPSYSNMEEVD